MADKQQKERLERIQTMSPGRPEYPALLKEIRDFPGTLYYIGTPNILKGKCVSIVGSRKTTQYGRSTAYGFGKKLGQRDVTVVAAWHWASIPVPMRGLCRKKESRQPCWRADWTSAIRRRIMC